MPETSSLALTLLIVVALGLAFLTPWLWGSPGDQGSWEELRADMIRDIEADVRATRRQIGKEHLDPRVMEAMATVPRHELVPEAWRGAAYENRPLPIGQGQTISQPYIVALMTDLLEPEPGDVMLDVGTGSGYQAAVLAELVEKVYSIEIVPELGRTAAKNLERLGYANVEVRIGDGFLGWPEKAPFDGIVVAAAIDRIPPPLVEQLAVGGRLVLPRGNPATSQDLVVLVKDENGELYERSVLPVRFVPLTGDHGAS